MTFIKSSYDDKNGKYILKYIKQENRPFSREIERCLVPKKITFRAIKNHFQITS